MSSNIENEVEDNIKSLDNNNNKFFPKVKNKDSVNTLVDETDSQKFFPNQNYVKSRNKTDDVKKGAYFNTLYSFKTYFYQEKCCHPLKKLNQVIKRKSTDNLLKNNSINRAFITTKDTDSLVSFNKKSSSSLINPNTNCKNSSCNNMSIQEKLYNNRLAIKLKHKDINESEINDLNKSNIPLINENSKKLVGRDPNYWFKRLFPKSKIDSEIDNLKKNPLENKDSFENKINSRNKIPNSKTFDFNPHISISSKTFALRNGSTVSRILQKKIYKTNENHESNSGKMKFLKTLQSNKSNKNNSSHYLFEQAQLLQRRKEEKIKKRLVEEENRLKEDNTFKPDLSQSKLKMNNVINKQFKRESIYKRQDRWKKSISSKKDQKKEYLINLEMEACTFKPKIFSVNIPDDDKFINKNLLQIMNFVKKRQNFFEKNRENVIYENKKFFKSGNFTMKPTIINEFDLKSNRLNRSVSHINKYKLDSKEIRSKIKNKDFFTEKFSFNEDDNIIKKEILTK